MSTISQLWPDIEHGDAEAAIVDILLNETPELVDSDVTFSTNLVNYKPEDRWVCVEQQGALERWPVIYKPRIDIEVRAERRSVALDIAQICVKSIKRQAGTYRGFGLFISHVGLEQGPIRIPDNEQETSRYVTSLRLVTRPDGLSLSPPQT